MRSASKSRYDTVELPWTKALRGHHIRDGLACGVMVLSERFLIHPSKNLQPLNILVQKANKLSEPQNGGAYSITSAHNNTRQQSRVQHTVWSNAISRWCSCSSSPVAQCPMGFFTARHNHHLPVRYWLPTRMCLILFLCMASPAV